MVCVCVVCVRVACRGVEARVPFLDRHFLDIAMAIDPAEKMIDKSKGEPTSSTQMDTHAVLNSAAVRNTWMCPQSDTLTAA